MKLGVSTACFYPLETEKSLEILCKDNVKNIEIFFNCSCELEDGFVKELKAMKDGYGVNITSVHPTMSLAESFMLFSAYERRTREGIEQYKRYAEISAQLGADFIIMHGGKPNKVINDEEYCERFFNIARIVKENGSTLLQENVSKYRAGSLEVLSLMSERLGEYANFCIDVKQCIRAGYSPFDALKVAKGHIRHIHLSDHSETNDCLLPLDGDFDFKKFIETAKDCGFDGTAITEVYKDAYTDYGQVAKSFFRLEKELEKYL